MAYLSIPRREKNVPFEGRDSPGKLLLQTNDCREFLWHVRLRYERNPNCYSHEDLENVRMPNVATITPKDAPIPIGPYSHIARVGTFITIGGVAGIDPRTGELAGPDVGTQTRQVLKNMSTLLASVDSDLEHVVHVNVFLLHMSDFEAMNRVYAECMGSHRPARTVIGVHELPKPGVFLTMNLTAVTTY